MVRWIFPSRLRLMWRVSRVVFLGGLLGVFTAGCLSDFSSHDTGVDGGPDAVADAGPDTAADGSPDTGPDASLLCGNGVLDPGEQCDATDLGGENCVTQGWVAGHLSCAGCVLDDSGCRNTCGGGTAETCPASSVSDDFDDGVTGLIWGYSYFDPGASSEELNGELVMTLPLAAQGYAVYQTHNPYDLRTYAITVELVSAPAPVPSSEGSLEIAAPNTGDLLGVTVMDGSVLLFMYLDDVSIPVVAAPYDAGTHRFLRLRAQGGYVFADTSPDGVGWMNLGSVLAPFSMDAVHLGLKAGIWSPHANPGEVRFDNFNILP